MAKNERYGDLFRKFGVDRKIQEYNDLHSLTKSMERAKERYGTLFEDVNDFSKFARGIEEIRNNPTSASSAETAKLCHDCLYNAYFAVGKLDNKETVFIFDDVKECLLFCQENSPLYEEMSFSVFEDKYIDEYKNAKNYIANRDTHIIIFQPSSR